MPTPLTADQLENSLPEILESPKDKGALEMIVIRPQKNARKVLDSCELSFANGANGDHWARGCWKSLPDGSPHPDVQIAIMNSRALKAVAGSKERWPLAGDNLIVDLDLSSENLSPGQTLQIGEAELEITNVPHSGCAKFMDRYGKDAVRYFNSKKGKAQHLRGVYARVVRDGTVRLGDAVRKVQGTEA